MKKIIKIIVILWLVIMVIQIGAGWWLNSKIQNNQNLLDPLRGYVIGGVTPKVEPTVPVEVPVKPTIRAGNVIKITPKATGDTGTWGVATQVGEDTWTMKVGMDKKMGTPEEILKALNDYRVRRGSQPLTWDKALGDFAQERADYLNGIRSTDDHKGFFDFLENQDGYDKLGFTWLGENISYGYQLEAVHLIEWLYAGDKPHDDNQVNNRWNYVGIGVKGLATSLIFGTGKR